jgi:hypothetical protein
MFDPLDATTGWAAVQDAANLSVEATNFVQGAGGLKFDKNGTGTTTGIYRKKLLFPVDVSALAASLNEPLIKFRTYHANYTNVSKVWFRLVYRFSTAGAPDVYEQFEKASPSAGHNSVSVSFASPSTSLGSPQPYHRSRCQALELGIQMGAAANTITGVVFDIAEMVGTRGPSPSLWHGGGYYVPLPPLDAWDLNPIEQVQVNEAPQAIETQFLSRRDSVRIAMGQIRAVYEANAHVHGLEECLRRIAQYVSTNQGWGLAWPARELVNTTLSGAATAGDFSISLTSVKDLSFLGLDGTLETATAGLRIGPNASRQYDRVQAIGYSGTTVYLDRPLSWSHASGVGVYSARYYPNLAKVSPEHAVSEAQQVRFELTAREAA